MHVSVHNSTIDMDGGPINVLNGEDIIEYTYVMADTLCLNILDEDLLDQVFFDAKERNKLN